MVDISVWPGSALADLKLPLAKSIVTVADAGAAARFVYRGASEHLAQAFGPVPSVAPNSAAVLGDRTALWLGPDEWLLMANPADLSTLGKHLRSQIAGRGSLVDVSHRNVGLVVAGPGAAELLNAGCPLDLDAKAFPVGMCTRTLFAKAEVILWRTTAEAFRIEVWRSFAPYVVGMLREASRDQPSMDVRPVAGPQA